MKKFIYTALMFFALQIGFAQASVDAKTFVENIGVKKELEGAKQEMMSSIQSGKEADFAKEFDEVVDGFILSFSVLVDENFDIEQVKEANVKFSQTKEITQLLPKDSEAFQEKITTLQNEMSMNLEGVVMKYLDPALLEAEE